MAASSSHSSLLLALLLLFAAPCRAFPLQLKASVISAPPTLLPSIPELEATVPAAPPDVMPAFPAPSVGGAPQSSFPTIPSSPSPPNPDDLQPGSKVAPAAALKSEAARVSGGTVVCGLLLMWWLEITRNRWLINVGLVDAICD